jgi:hypothetical protein
MKIDEHIEVLVILEEDFDYTEIIGVILPQSLNDFIENTKKMMMNSQPGLLIENVDYFPQIEKLAFRGNLLGTRWLYDLTIKGRLINKIYKG